MGDLYIVGQVNIHKLGSNKLAVITLQENGTY